MAADAQLHASKMEGRSHVGALGEGCIILAAIPKSKDDAWLAYSSYPVKYI